MASKFRVYDEQVSKVLFEITEKGLPIRPLDVARLVCPNFSAHDIDVFRVYIMRHQKRLLNQHEGVYNLTDELDVPNTNVKHLWVKNKGVSMFVKNPDYVEPQEQVDELKILREQIVNEVKAHAPTYRKIKRVENSRKRLLVFDPADLHIGKLASSFECGADYNSQIAVNRALDGCKGILNEVNYNNIDKVMFVIGNDILHVDTPHNTTTSGIRQDASGMWYDNFIMAKKLYVEIIEIFLDIADVHLVFNPSNHDYQTGFFLAQVIQSHFSKSNNITFDVSIAHRKYYTYYNNIIGTTHGDGAKTSDLPLLMAHETPDWSKCKHKYFYTHHIHHKQSKDYMGVCVEALRSPSEADSWHSRNGYVHAPKAVEAFLHDKEHGQVARFSYIF